MIRAMAPCLTHPCLTLLCLSFLTLPAACSAAALPPTAPGSDWQARVVQSIASGEYRAATVDGAVQAPNRRQGFRTHFHGDGIAVVERADAATVLLRLELAAWGRTRAMTPATTAQVQERDDRVDLVRPGLREWFRNSAAGLEQGFDLEHRPAGAGPLRFELAVHGAQPVLEGARIALHREDETLHYSGLRAWDASGRTLPAQMAAAGQQISLVVDDTGAHYPITIDPLLTGTADAQLESEQGSGQSGHSVAQVGDLNGDGFGDVAVGAFGYDGGATNSGAVFVYFGSATGVDTTADGLLTLNIANARLGGSVAAAGDVNGDGYADLVAGAANYSNGQTNEGAAFVWFGGPGTTFNTVADGVLEENQANAFLGGSVAGVGDVNFDGFADVAVGAAAWDNSANGNEGRVFLYFGSGGAGAPFNTSADVQMFSSQLNAAFGSSIAGGNVNGDSFSDVIVGALLYDNGETDEGNAFVYLGAISFDTVVDAELQSNVAGAQLGGSVAVVGDVNGDGRADVLCGARRWSSGQSGEGAAFLFFGGAGAFDTVVDAILEGNQVDAEFGTSVAAAGDVNGDGFGDLLVGAPLFDVAVGVEGAAFLFLGGNAAFDLVADNTLTVPVSSRMGFSVGGGDVNGDGFADVLVGAPSFNGGLAEEGAALVYLGGARGLDAGGDGTVSSPQGSAQVGHSVASGDVNGDGYSDLVVGAFGFDRPNFTNAGAVFIYFGNGGGFNTVADAQLGIDQAETRFGSSVAVGDVNGDGIADVLVGASEFESGQADEGAAFLYFGAVGAFNTVADAQLQSNQPGAQLGASVAVIGDVNGDGYNDIALGAPLFDDGNTDEGAVFVHLGGPGLNLSPVANLQVGQNSAFLGGSVAGAGDVNGDGLADLIVGGVGFDATGATNSGVVQLYFGAAGNGFDAVADAQLVSTAGARLGSSLGSAGDVNGDGFADVVVGALEYSAGQTNEGAAFLYFGGAGAFNTSPDAELQGNQVGAGMGSSVAGGGDVNGDGFGDLLIGAVSLDAGQADEGAAFVFFGGAGAFNTAADAQIEANQATARFGFAASFGDVNADGFADAIIGAPSLDVATTDDGAALLYMGNSSGRPAVAEQLSDYAGPLATWGLSRRATGFLASMDVRSPRGRELAKLEIESCPSALPFGAPGCTRQLASAWSDLGTPGPFRGIQTTQLTVAVNGLSTNSVQHWRVRVLYLPFSGLTGGVTAPPKPLAGPWRRMQARTDVAEVRISDQLLRNGFE